MGSSVKKVIRDMDRFSASYGMATQNLNTMPYQPQVSELSVMPAISSPAVPISAVATMTPSNPQPVVNSANPFINARTYGTSTFTISITNTVAGTGSGNTANPVWLFGANAYNNTSRPYNVVQNAGQTISVAVVNNKNVIRFVYGAGGNTSTYTVSLKSEGEYPYVLNSQVGKRGLLVTGVQFEVADAADAAQLSEGLKTFYVNEFGKSTTNDLTTPRDLYQYNSNGVFIPHKFVIDGDNGLQLSVIESDGLILTAYFYASPLV